MTMRELTLDEVEAVSGGYKIGPRTNPNPNDPAPVPGIPC